MHTCNPPQLLEQRQESSLGACIVLLASVQLQAKPASRLVVDHVGTALHVGEKRSLLSTCFSNRRMGSLAANCSELFRWLMH